VKARFSAPFQTGHRTQTASYKISTEVSFPVVKRLRCGVNHTTLSSAEVKEKVELYVYSSSVPSWHVKGQTSYLPITLYNNDLDSGKIWSGF